MVDQSDDEVRSDSQHSNGDPEEKPKKPHSLLWHCRKLVGLHELPEDVGDWLNAALALVVVLASLAAIGTGLGAVLRLLLGWGWPGGIAVGCAVLLAALVAVYWSLSRRWATASQREEKVKRYWWVVLCFVAVGVVSWAVVGGSDLLSSWMATPTPVASLVPPTAPPVSPTPSPPDVRIRYVEYDPEGPDREGEFVLIENLGGSAQDVTGWTLEDEAHHSYRFRPFSLEAGAGVRVWTGEGDDSQTDLYWGCGQGIWTNEGDTAYLRDDQGRLIDEYSY
jgi:hypothetical protein